ncbi:MAG TPA: c-type cytochrome [Bryobacteraceae bacterium]|nr:c-type cytochrome [Bryobacteraceae bacterium]
MHLRIALVLLACSVLGAQELKNPYSGDSAAAQSGYLVFRIYCSPCHGIHAQGGRGPDLTRGVYAHGDRDEDLYRTIGNGVPGTEMAGLGGELGDDNVWRVVTYLRSIVHRENAAVPGNPAAGEKLFWTKGACGQCHVVNAKGGHLGPELSLIGRERSLEYLKESVVEPDKDVSPGFATITIVKRDGTKLVGVERGYDNFSVQIMDAGENYFSFLRSDVTSVKREFRSLMPANYGKLFKAAELDDLLAYLTTLRGAEAKQ